MILLILAITHGRQKSLSDNTLEHVPVKDANTVASKMDNAEKDGVCGRSMQEKMNSEFRPPLGRWLIFCQSLLEVLFPYLLQPGHLGPETKKALDPSRDGNVILKYN